MNSSASGNAAADSRRWRVALVCSHGIQYLLPWFQQLSQHPRLDVTVLLGNEQGLKEGGIDPDFGRAVKWDVDLAGGLRLQTLRSHSPRPGVDHFWGVASLDVFSQLTKQHFDAVVIQGWNYALYPLALLAARKAGLPVLMRAESGLLPGHVPAARPLKDLILRRYLGMCAGALAVSSGNRRLLEHYGIPSARIFHSPYAVDGARFVLSERDRQEARQRLRSSLGMGVEHAAVPVLLACGKLTAVKQPQLLLAAYAALRQSGVDAALVFCGDGPLRAELQQQVQQQHIPNVSFVGFQNQSQLPAWYAAADALVLPSRSETFGIVVAEAMHAGLPVVVSDHVGCAEDLVLPKQTGLQFPRDDVRALQDALGWLCDAQQGMQRRAQLGMAAREHIATWTYEQATAGLLFALQQVCPKRA